MLAKLMEIFMRSGEKIPMHENGQKSIKAVCSTSVFVSANSFAKVFGTILSLSLLSRWQY